MTRTEREEILEAVADAVLACPQLRTDPRLTMGQRLQAAKQISAVVARKIALKDRIVYRDDPDTGQQKPKSAGGSHA